MLKRQLFTSSTAREVTTGISSVPRLLAPQRFGGTTSNILADPASGRWFNPPHLWTACDVLFPGFFLLSIPSVVMWMGYGFWYMPTYSHYQDQNYYHKQPHYTKEFIHKYKRMERWRHY